MVACFVKASKSEFTSAIETTTFFNPILNVACLPHCHSLLVRGKLIKGRGFHETIDIRKWGSQKANSEAASYTYQKIYPQDDIANASMILQ